MGKRKYTNETIEKAIALRLQGLTIPEITVETGMGKPSLQKLFRQRNIKLDEEQKSASLAKRWEDHEPIVDGCKICSKCKISKPLDQFHTNNNRLTGITSSCKECAKINYQENAEVVKARVRKYNAEHKEEKHKRDKEYYESHKEVYIENSKKWHENNPEKAREIVRNYGKRNQPKKNARTAFRRAMQIKATPSWLTQHQRDEIRRMYENCPKGFHVDHIVPLRGENVSGLHVPWNLQYLPAVENMSKGNKF